MQSGSWSSYQAALPPEARAGGEPDDEGPMGRHDHEPPREILVLWYRPVACRDYATGEVEMLTAQFGRAFGAERWRWRHVLAWRDAMARRYGHAEIKEVF